jgi:FAD/FMN-containing dehydrogenase
MLIDEIRAIVGPLGCTTDPEDLAPHLVEWRDAVRGKALLMASPATTAEVASVVRVCAAAGVSVVPQGGNTGLCAGAIPDQSGEQVLLSLRRMDRIRSVDASDFSMVVEAGCILADIQNKARDAGRYFPLSLAAEGSCQIGGNLSTNAGGINVIRYGTARQQVLGLEVVLANGTVWHGLRSLRKDTAGYDMKQLFIGSEGTLGIITAATLRLFPAPAATATACIALSSAQQAVDLLGYMREALGDRIQAFELIADRALRFVERHLPNSQLPFQDDSYPWFVLVDAISDGGDEQITDVLSQAIESGLAEDVIIAKSTAEAERLWHLRHSISEAEKSEGACLKHDVSVPIGRIGDFLQQAERLVQEQLPRSRLVVFGHVGDGNLHYNVTQVAGDDRESFLAAGIPLTEALYALVADMGGSISAEHGIGVLKKDQLRRYRSAVELDLMRIVKSALDPKNTLNPGKVI